MKTEMASHNSSGLNSETTISLSQSMETVNSITSVEDEVRTLFVSGLPMDAKPRELYLLFRAYKGYETALLKMMGKPGKNNSGYEGSLLKVTNKNGKNTSPVGFVTFSSRVAAEAAKQDLQGVRFDPDLPQTLRLEFAKSNTKVTKPKQQSPQPAATHPTLIHPITGQELGAAFFPGAGAEAWAPHHLAPYPDLSPTATLHHHTALLQHPALAQVPVRIHHPTMVGQSAAMPHPSLGATPILTSHLSGSPLTGLTNGTTAHQSFTAGHHNAPCSTLFVANLGQFSSEQELKDLFSSFQGFSRLRMYNKGGSPVAFVEYQDVKQASDALSRLQGFVMLSSDRGGIRIEYAKSKMGEVGMKKDDSSTATSPIPPTASF